MKKQTDSIIFLVRKRTIRVLKVRYRHTRKKMRLRLDRQREKLNSALTTVPLRRKQYHYFRKFSNQASDDSLLRPKAKKSHSVKLPRVFSLIDNPEESLLALSEVINKLRNRRVKNVDINHDDVEEIDYAAEALLSIFACETKKHLTGC